MERQKHHQEKHGNGPNQHHYKEGAYNKHAGTHFYQESKGGQQMKHDHEYKPEKKHDHENHAV
ncbi:MAG: hypothetical protein AAB323_01645 [Pseudomonadota bacterium]